MKNSKKKKIDVHTEHCCVIHGCKYGRDNCTVMLLIAPQSYICESCEDNGIKTIDELNNVLSGKVKTCPYCRHTL